MPLEGRGPGTISFSFQKLQRVELSFVDRCAGHMMSRPQERTLVRLVRDLGATAVPLLMRHLTGTHEGAAQFAYFLLGQVAEAPALRARVVAALREAATRPELADLAKLPVLALLTDLGAELPAEAQLDDAGAARARSLRELATCLDAVAEVARCADVLLSTLSPVELVRLVEELVVADPVRAASLCDELLLRDDLDDATRLELRRGRPAGLASGRLRTVGAAPAATVLTARPPGGALVMVATQRLPRSRPARFRALTVRLGAGGELDELRYHLDLTANAVDRELLAPLRGAGCTLRRTARATAARRLTGALCGAPRPLPRDYYLGRDLLGIYDEHLAAVPDLPAAGPGVLLARALDLLASGDSARARPLFESYVSARPRDPEGCANLGVCLLRLDDPAAARTHLMRAASLDPDNAIHHWNLAAAASRSGRLGGCYLALLDYLARRDPMTGADERQREARTYTREYERLAHIEYPDLAPHAVAQREDPLGRLSTGP